MRDSSGVTAEGLDGVVVASTRLSEVDGAAGRLIIGGLEVEALAGAHPFEAACGLLWEGALPDGARLEALRRELGAGREAAWALLPGLEGLMRLGDGMAALQGAVAALPEVGEDAARITGAVGVFAAAWLRRQAGEALLAPEPGASHAADVLRMALGPEGASAGASSALDAYLTTVIDHGLNASTFTARVVASTGASRTAAVSAAVGALKGPLHGGAPGPVLDMLDAIGEASAAGRWLEAALASGQRIMGMGHRIYRARDPRAAVLEGQLRRLAAGSPTPRLALARAVEAEAERLLALRSPARALRANVEFYTATLLEAIGIPRSGFSLLFAAGRAAGWCAHAAEQQAVGRLIRPASRYVGPRPA